VAAAAPGSTPPGCRSLVIRGGGIITRDSTPGDLLTADVHIRDGKIIQIGKDLPNLLRGSVSSSGREWTGAMA